LDVVPCLFGLGPISGPGPSPPTMAYRLLRGTLCGLSPRGKKGPRPKVTETTSACALVLVRHIQARTRVTARDGAGFCAGGVKHGSLQMSQESPILPSKFD
jgi:hypothetical protein